MRRLALRSTMLAFVIAIAIGAGACGVPTDETAQEIDPQQLPESLRPDFHPTTTTSEPPIVVTESATVYLLWLPPDTDRRVVVDVTREVQVDASLEAVLSTLFGADVRTEEEVAAGYSSALFELDLVEASVAEGVATIDMVPLNPEGEPSEEPFTGDLLGAAAQLVWTATEYEEVIGVRILLDGDEVPIPTPTQDAAGGQVLTRTDYESFDPNQTPEVISTTTSTTTMTSTTTTTPTTTTSLPGGDVGPT